VPLRRGVDGPDGREPSVLGGGTDASNVPTSESGSRPVAGKPRDGPSDLLEPRRALHGTDPPAVPIKDARPARNAPPAFGSGS
jgi:hypothetical protein